LYTNQRVVYPDDCHKRSDQSFREQHQKEHHINISPLLRIQPPIDLIYAFPLDYMCCLGIVKKFYVMDLIFNKTAVRFRSTLKQQLFEQITFIKSFVPDEFQRKPRPFVPNLKAELRFIVVFQNNFMQFVMCNYIIFLFYMYNNIMLCMCNMYMRNKVMQSVCA